MLELVSKIDIFVEADKERITQVISNLLNNAVKFTSEEGGGTISISIILGKIRTTTIKRKLLSE